jgi:hypothetical protein
MEEFTPNTDYKGHVTQDLTPYERELRALLWLHRLPRQDWREAKGWRWQEQIVIRLVPGTLYAREGGAPLVKVLVTYPGIEERVTGGGNSLAEAVEDVHRELWRLGIKTPVPNW